MEMYTESSSPSSARSARGSSNKLRSTICCFRTKPEEMTSPVGGTRTPARSSPYAWLKSTAHELDIKYRCGRVKARVKESCRQRCLHPPPPHHHHHQQQHHHHHGSGDFSYDPLSYALNFEDDLRSSDDDDYLPSFTSRLPPTPDRKFGVAETTSVKVVRVS